MVKFKQLNYFFRFRKKHHGTRAGIVHCSETPLLDTTGQTAKSKALLYHKPCSKTFNSRRVNGNINLIILHNLTQTLDSYFCCCTLLLVAVLCGVIVLQHLITANCFCKIFSKQKQKTKKVFPHSSSVLTQQQ